MVEDKRLPRGPILEAAQFYPPEIRCSENNLGIGLLGPFAAEPPFDMPWTRCQGLSAADRHASSPWNTAGAYSPVYYAGAIPFYALARPAGVDIRAEAVRLWSVLLGVLAAMFAYLAARWALPESRGLAAAAGVMFALQPMNSQQTAIVNNDALLIAAAAGFWWRFYRSLELGVSNREGLILGGLVGLCYLAKPQGALLAAALPALVLSAAGDPRSWFDWRRLWKPATLFAGSMVLCFLVGEIFTISAGNHSSLPAASAGVHGVRQYVMTYSAEHFARAYWLWVTSFWGYFGWFSVALPSYVYVLIALAVGAGAIGVAVTLIRRKPERHIVLASVLAYSGPAILLQVLELYVFRSSGQLILQGRSFLMLLIPVVILLIRGWQGLLPSRAGVALGPAVTLAALLLNMLSLFVMVDAFYG